MKLLFGSRHLAIVCFSMAVLISCKKNKSSDTPSSLQAKFSITKNGNYAPVEVLFKNESSTDATEYLWDFGDNKTSTLKEPSVFYSLPGTYIVKLTVKKSGISNTYTQTITIPADPDLVAYYPFNGNPNDVVASKNGTVYNAVLTTDKNNKAQSAYEFNGTGAYIQLPESLIKNTGNATSISLWFQSASPVNYGGLFGYQDRAVNTTPTQYVPSIYIGSDNKIHGKFWFGTNAINASEILDANWHHLILSGDAEGQNLYIDGTKINGIADKVDNSLNMIYNQLGVAYIGGSWAHKPTGDNWYYFKGKIDNVRIYKKKITESEIPRLVQEMR